MSRFRTHCSYPGDDGCGDGGCGHKCVVVAGDDAAPILDLVEHVLDLVALSIARIVVGYWDFSI